MSSNDAGGPTPEQCADPIPFPEKLSHLASLLDAGQPPGLYLQNCSRQLWIEAGRLIRDVAWAETQLPRETRWRRKILGEMTTSELSRFAALKKAIAALDRLCAGHLDGSLVDELRGCARALREHEPADGPGPEPTPALTLSEYEVLRTLGSYKPSVCIRIANLSQGCGLSDRTAGGAITRLISLGLACRPRGIKGGVQLTNQGRRTLSARRP